MDMSDTLQELSNPYCDKHKCKKQFSKEIVGGSWICPKCSEESGLAFKLIIGRLKEQHKEENACSTFEKVDINIKEPDFWQILEELSQKWDDIK